jgi:uncharacterized protein YchJ
MNATPLASENPFLLNPASKNPSSLNAQRHGLFAASIDAGSIDKEAVAKEQKSVDRARAQTFTRLCRSISELRKIQTEHIIREQIHADVPGLTESKQVVSAMRLRNRAKSEAQQATNSDDNPEVFDAFLARAGRPAPQPPAEAEISFCKPASATAAQAENTPRNATCPCRSGLKFKKCCARGGAKWSALSPKTASSGPVPLADAPPVLAMAA